jgi:hypothetical protein
MTATPPELPAPSVNGLQPGGQPSPPACAHAALVRQLQLRLFAGVASASAEGTQGWCETCREWVQVGA